MDESDEHLIKFIRHYQDSLERHSEKRNETKLLHSIEKLYKLPIKVTHLEATGVGRTVNGLRKLGGDVGSAAKSLVAKWKEMVVVEEDKQEAKDSPDIEIQDEDADIDLKYTEECSSSYKESDKNNAYKSKDRENSKSKSKHRKNDKHEDRHKHKKRKHESDSESKSSDSDFEEEKHHRKKNKKQKASQRDSSESEDEKSSHKSKKRQYEDSDSEESEDDRTHKSKYTKDDSESDDEEKYSKLKYKTESKSSKNSHSDSEEKSSKRDRSKSKSSSKSQKDSDLEHNKHDKLKHKSSKSVNKENEDESKSKHHKKDLHSKESKSSSEKSKHKESKSSDKSKKDESRKSEKKSKDCDELQKKTSAPSNSKHEEKSSKKHKSSKEKSEKKESTKAAPIKLTSDKTLNGIDSGSGASFAEALGMCAPIKASSTTSKKKAATSTEKSKSSASSSSTSSHKEKSDRMSKIESDTLPMPSLLLKEPLAEPLDLNISSLLPSITPNYRPLGNVVFDSNPIRKALTDDEALSRVISTKNQRTKVYSGNKVVLDKVPSLFEICVRILQDNIDALEFTGGVPYSILKPILEKANPDQLYMMEHHNPYLIEDTDELWQLHCQKEFKTKRREEMESWRDMYMRCLDEREAKLKALTANIKQAQDKSIPVRTTKLAYVDSFVKPPRNIIRKQMKNGTGFEKKPAQTPSSRLTAIATAGEAGKVAVPSPGVRAAESSRSSSSSSMKPAKKAPLMAKTLSFMKNRFKR